MTAAEKRAAGIAPKPKSKPSPKTTASSDPSAKESPNKQNKSDSQGEQAPSPPKPRIPINSATLDQLNKFMCAEKAEDGDQPMKNETK